jgi:hypothetical protein
MKFLSQLFLSAVVLAAGSSIALAETTVFVDDGVLYGLSDSSVFKSDLSTGERTVTFSDGGEMKWQSLQPSGQGHSGLQHIPDGVVWIEARSDVWEFPKSEGMQADPAADASLQGACSSQANALAAAIQGVQAACSGGNEESGACISAIDFYDAAEMTYNACIRREFEEIK